MGIHSVKPLQYCNTADHGNLREADYYSAFRQAELLPPALVVWLLLEAGFDVTAQNFDKARALY
jgi:hypothetical protein